MKNKRKGVKKMTPVNKGISLYAYEFVCLV